MMIVYLYRSCKHGLIVIIMHARTQLSILLGSISLFLHSPYPWWKDHPEGGCNLEVDGPLRGDKDYRWMIECLSIHERERGAI